jgi:alpha-glucosidase
MPRARPAPMTFPWWQRGVIYQIYPRSFADTNGDGVGDLPGVTKRLAYLAWLGIDAVWLSPIYPSPMADFGYDVTDHTAVDLAYGTLDDFDALISEARRLRIRVLLDYIPNHTSSEHPWFEEACSSRLSRRRDWYLWRDPQTDGDVPNNWRSVFGGPAWTFHQQTGQYYYHAYLPQQPDLNWRQSAVREAMFDVLRFWLDRGVAGFRVDALRHLLKDTTWRDNPPNPDFRPDMAPYWELLPVHSADLDELHELTASMRRVLAEYDTANDERVLIGELYVPIDRLVRYYGPNGSELQIPSNMHLLDVDWTPEAVAALIERYESALPAAAWPNWVLGNHDRSRIATRIGKAQARVAAMLLLTLRGTPTMYYGDEIAMTDVLIERGQARDPVELRLPGIGAGRDPERSPMQWNPEANAGFCASHASPWLPVSRDYGRVNVALQRTDERSMLTLYRRLLGLRRARTELAVGDYRTLFAGDGVLAYARDYMHKRIAVALNFDHQPRKIVLPGRLLLSTRPDRLEEAWSRTVTLAPDEGVIVDTAPARLG